MSIDSQKPNLGFIVQARIGSNRLPGKVVLPFWNGQSILEIILGTLLRAGVTKEDITVATSDLSQDDIIAEVSHNQGVRVYRGSENNVLSRFLEVGELNNYDYVVRICADNPMLSVEGIKTLVTGQNKHRGVDYLSFVMDSSPVILNHIGRYAELVRLDALKKVNAETDNPLYLEHVTNYIHQQPDKFDVVLLELPESWKNRTDLRFTCDTHNDFLLLQEVFEAWSKSDFDEDVLLELVDEHPEWIQSMKEQIKENKK